MRRRPRAIDVILSLTHLPLHPPSPSSPTFLSLTHLTHLLTLPFLSSLPDLARLTHTHSQRAACSHPAVPSLSRCVSLGMPSLGAAESPYENARAVGVC